MSVIVVTGTSTGVGKTVVTAAVAALARSSGLRVAVVKPAQTGTDLGDSDVREIGRLTGLPDAALVELARYPEPLAPATAARRADQPQLRLADAVRALRELDRAYDLVLVEGAGGLLVQFDDLDGWTLAELAVELDVPVLVVVAAGLGTLNHTALTLEALAARSLRTPGLVIGSWPEHPGLAERCNVADLAALSEDADLLGAVPAGAGQATDTAAFLGVVERALAPSLGGTFDAADFIRIHAPEPKAAE